MISFSKLRVQSDRIGTEFLLTELEMASTFLQVASQTANEDVRKRNEGNALKAYKTILRMRGMVLIAPEPRTRLERGLAELERQLTARGVTLSSSSADQPSE